MGKLTTLAAAALSRYRRDRDPQALSDELNRIGIDSGHLARKAQALSGGTVRLCPACRMRWLAPGRACDGCRPSKLPRPFN